MGSPSIAAVSYKQLALLGHPVTPATVRDKIKRTFNRGTGIDRRSNPFPALLSLKIYNSSSGSEYKYFFTVFKINDCVLILRLRFWTPLFWTPLFYKWSEVQKKIFIMQFTKYTYWIQLKTKILLNNYVHKIHIKIVGILLTVHLSIFISVINQLDAKKIVLQ